MSDYRFRILALAVVATAALSAQTQIDLRTQAKSVDFSGAQTTKPFRMGTALPASCTIGEAFFKSDAPAGQNLYGCTAANTWTQLSASSFSGDVSGTSGATQVTAIQNRAVAATSPANNDVLTWSTSNNRWQPAAATAGSATHFSTGTALPSTCTVGDAFFNSSAPAGSNLNLCTSTDVWSQIAIPVLGGDISGSGSSTQVVGLRGRSLSSTAPSAGQTMVFNSTTNTWEPGLLGIVNLASQAISGTGSKLASTDGLTTSKCLESLSGKIVESAGPCAGGFTNADGTLNASGLAGRPVVMSARASDFRLGGVSGSGPTFITGDGTPLIPGDVLRVDEFGNAISGGAIKARVCSVVYVNSSKLRLAPAASATTPCVIGASSSPVLLPASVDVNISGTSGNLWIGFDKPSGLPVVYQSASGLAACSQQGCTVTTAPNPPTTFEPIWSWIVAAGTVVASGGTDLVAEVSTGLYPTPGNGIMQTISNGQVTTAVNTTVIPTHLPVVAATVDFAAVDTGNCGQSAVAVSGASANDRVLVGPPVDLAPGIIVSAWVSSSSTITVQACNLSGSVVDLEAATWKFEVIR